MKMPQVKTLKNLSSKSLLRDSNREVIQSKTFRQTFSRNMSPKDPHKDKISYKNHRAILHPAHSMAEQMLSAEDDVASKTNMQDSIPSPFPFLESNVSFPPLQLSSNDGEQFETSPRKFQASLPSIDAEKGLMKNSNAQVHKRAADPESDTGRRKRKQMELEDMLKRKSQKLQRPRKL
ncbi:hypothetical protein NEOLI_003929 [Neolecta irregularis DAH-3]|uniref:Uncharacterized protein n=1 Tax=Neolecta irregularis (strain DAH-3) TaxID=1198029 RepID=A0A1U7LI84_NEOID|nr:hypothetical protein NEOLI_003929 [Neolecta irregularis DAH-3]|eukprot:OLL22354.1 hypothetical protein NEOLI_003929 [Neolecta irregularis DAH-3]